MTEDFIDTILRLGAAAAAGMIIGINRDMADKPIGMRTLGLVALGAAVVSLSTIRVEGMADNPDAMSRVVQGIIQGIMAGISFIGAGVILRDTQAKTVEGLTTAATVWVTAALGIACGACRLDYCRRCRGARPRPARRDWMAGGHLFHPAKPVADPALARSYCALLSAAIRSSTATRLR